MMVQRVRHGTSFWPQRSSTYHSGSALVSKPPYDGTAETNLLRRYMVQGSAFLVHGHCSHLRRSVSDPSDLKPMMFRCADAIRRPVEDIDGSPGFNLPQRQRNELDSSLSTT